MTEKKTSRFKVTVVEPGGRSCIEVITWAFDVSNASEVTKLAYNKRTKRQPYAFLKVDAHPSPDPKKGEIIPDDNKCHVFYKGEKWSIS